MDNYPEPCMCGAIDCRICGPLQGYRVKSTAQLWDCEDGYEDEMKMTMREKEQEVYRDEMVDCFNQLFDGRE